jgi:DNA-binding NtrC family response regulator
MGNSTVLVIDYDERIRQIIKLQLKSLPYIIREASTSREAFCILKNEKVDTVICDLKMKDIDGFDILRRIKARFPSLPIIILTGFIEKDYAEKADALGCFDFINKPVKREKLREVLSRALKIGSG